MHFFKHILMISFVMFATFISVGCSGGEADYSLRDVTGSSLEKITFVTSGTIVVEENTNDITIIKTDSEQALLYNIAGGQNKIMFGIDGHSGRLSFTTPALYLDGVLNNYEVVIGATSDMTEPSTLSMLITVVKDITIVAPIIDYVATNVQAISSTNTITQVLARPADVRSSLTYALSGTDAVSFNIDENGNISFSTPLPDFGTTPNKQYHVNVIVTDGYGNSTPTDVITVTLVGDPDLIRPVVVTEEIAIIENSLETSQIDVSTLGSGRVNSYILSGADASSFNLSTTGQLGFKTAKDFESLPVTFDIGVQVGDDNGNLSDIQQITVSVKDIDERFTFQNISDFTPMERDKTVGQVTATPNTAESLTIEYTLIQGGELLEIDSEGSIQFKALAEKGQSISVQVRVVSQYNGSETLSQTFSVTVVDDPSKIPPVIDPGYSVDNTVVSPIDLDLPITTVQASPSGDSTSITYTTSGADADKFRVDENGNLYFLDTYDYYANSDANGDNIFEVIVIVTDENGNIVSTQLITVQLLEDPSKIAPVITSATFDLDENERGDLAIEISSQGSGVVNSYNIVGGVDAGLFTFVDGHLDFAHAPDFETPSSDAGSNRYHVTLSVSDDKGNESVEQAIIVNILEVDETLEFTTLTSFSHIEGSTLVGTVAASPKLTMDASITYSIEGGSTDLSIDEVSGDLSFKAAPTYIADGNNDYTLTVVAQSQYNGSTTVSELITIKVMPKSFAVTFDSDQSSIEMDQNTEVSFPMTATSAANMLLSYSLEGHDPLIFSIDVSTGELTIKAPPYRFSAETDANVYRADVVASDDSGHSARRQGMLTVKAVDGMPYFTSATTRLTDENVKPLSAVIATSPIGSTLRYEKDGGADAGLFYIDPATGALSFAYAQNFEDPHDLNKDSVYEVNIRATDTLHAINSVTQTILVTVSNVDDAPSDIVFVSTKTTLVSVSDGEHVFIFPKNIVSYEQLEANPSPTAGSLTYSLINNTNSIFSISNDGNLKVDAPPFSDTETFTLTVRVAENKGESTDQIIKVTIKD